MFPELATAYLRWSSCRAAFARGYWLVTATYLVVVADLSPLQLALIGAFQALTVLLTEVPAGVLADAVSRRLALVIAHVVTGSGMAMAGLVESFPLLVVSQCLWGLGWAFASGADVAWLTDELDRPDLVDRVLVAQARWTLLGGPIGFVVFGALAAVTTLSSAIVAAGIGMVSLGLVVARWPETRFVPAPAGRRWREAAWVLRRGVAVARVDRIVLVLIVATALTNGGYEAFGRLRELRLITLGLPARPPLVIWFAALGVVGVALGASILRIVEARIDGVGAARRAYVLACAAGVVGLLLLARAGGLAQAVAGTLLVAGAAEPVLRATTTIWVNRRTPSEVRATVHSFLSQAENGGELVIGVVLAIVAGSVSPSAALTSAAVLFAGAGALVLTTKRGVSRGRRALATRRRAGRR